MLVSTDTPLSFMASEDTDTDRRIIIKGWVVTVSQLVFVRQVLTLTRDSRPKSKVAKFGVRHEAALRITALLTAALSLITYYR